MVEQRKDLPLLMLVGARDHLGVPFRMTFWNEDVASEKKLPPTRGNLRARITNKLTSAHHLQRADCCHHGKLNGFVIVTAASGQR